MPSTDGLQPALTAGEKAVVNSFGGWTAFMQVYGLKAHDARDRQEAHNIAKDMAQNDQADKRSKK